jgi:hypothetical protein
LFWQVGRTYFEGVIALFENVIKIETEAAYRFHKVMPQNS